MFNMNDFAGILRARTAGDLGTLLGNARLRLHAITVIFQGKINQLHHSYICTHSIFLVGIRMRLSHNCRRVLLFLIARCHISFFRY
jgi:hypothetical protein